MIHDMNIIMTVIIRPTGQVRFLVAVVVAAVVDGTIS